MAEIESLSDADLEAMKALWKAFSVRAERPNSAPIQLTPSTGTEICPGCGALGGMHVFDDAEATGGGSLTARGVHGSL